MSYYEDKLAQIEKDDLQLEAYNSRKSTVVLAGPGSGKTTVLTLKIMKLLKSEIVEPRGLACLTFSREAAREFETRLKKLGYTNRKNVFLGTVHSFCIAEVLSKFANLYGYYVPNPVRIISSSEKSKLFYTVKDDLGYGDQYLSVTDMDKERMLGISGISKVEIPSYDIALKVATEYENRLKELNLLDFELIVKYSTEIIQNHEYVRDCLLAKYPWILVDEYQDLGRPLHEMVLSLFTLTDIKIFAVGDPDQSIYGFSGAIPDYLRELNDRDDFFSIMLKNNYRSNQGIIDGSEAVLQKKREYNSVNRQGEKAEYKFYTCYEGLIEQFKLCASEIIPHYKREGINYKEISVLCKTQADVKLCASIFDEHGLPYYIAKRSFDRTEFVKWLEDCAKWLSGDYSILFNDLFVFWKVFKCTIDCSYMSDENEMMLKSELYQLLKESEKYNANLYNWLLFIFENLNVEELLSLSQRYPDELENIKKLVVISKEDEFKDFDISLFADLGKPKEQITITTRHSSKGLEFEIVILTGMEEGNFPDYRSVGNHQKMAEENRICFVCVSRAKRACVLIRSKNVNIKKRDGTIWIKPCEESLYWKLLYRRQNLDS